MLLRNPDLLSPGSASVVDAKPGLGTYTQAYSGCVGLRTSGGHHAMERPAPHRWCIGDKRRGVIYLFGAGDDLWPLPKDGVARHCQCCLGLKKAVEAWAGKGASAGAKTVFYIHTNEG